VNVARVEVENAKERLQQQQAQFRHTLNDIRLAMETLMPEGQVDAQEGPLIEVDLEGDDGDAATQDQAESDAMYDSDSNASIVTQLLEDSDDADGAESTRTEMSAEACAAKAATPRAATDVAAKLARDMAAKPATTGMKPAFHNKAVQIENLEIQCTLFGKNAADRFEASLHVRVDELYIHDHRTQSCLRLPLAGIRRIAVYAAGSADTSSFWNFYIFVNCEKPRHSVIIKCRNFIQGSTAITNPSECKPFLRTTNLCHAIAANNMVSTTGLSINTPPHHGNSRTASQLPFKSIRMQCLTSTQSSLVRSNNSRLLHSLPKLKAKR
jgi:hypothetical protein